jgi:GNAT superfamily N-acetyltransferase
MCVASINLARETDRMLATDSYVVRRSLEPGDGAAIADLHRRVYVPEFERNDEFLARVAAGIRAAIACGWPDVAGAVWLVQQSGSVRGSLALTDEGDGLGRVRWFALERALRGHGLGRSLIAELIARARTDGYRRLELETFSALRAAATIYRDAGFEVRWERERTDWGPPIVYQQYALDLV